MTSAIAHRGPDGEGSYTDPHRAVYFGHRRLAILDLEGGAQPMTTQDGELTVTFNGELYNFPSLRRELEARGHRFATSHSDTEILLHGYREWGDDLPLHLDGMFAFVVYDRAGGVLFGARDRFGEKPFFYHEGPELFAFGSELSVLESHPGVPKEISITAIQKYFAHCFIPAPHSMLKAVRQLPAGHRFRYDMAARRFTSESYWRYRLEPFDTIPADPVGEWGGRLRELLEASVRERMVADVPVGIFLSGGIDSSTIASLAVRSAGSAGAIRTFSIGFREPSFDESAQAEAMARSLGAQHRNRMLSIEDACGLFPEVAGRMDQPLADASILPTYLLCQYAVREVKVALSGDGGDELFAGYDPFKALRYARWYQALVPKPVHQAIGLIAGMLPVSHRNMSFDFKIKRALRGMGFAPSLWNPVWLGALTPEQIGRLTGTAVSQEELYSEAIEAWEHCEGGDLVDRTTQFFVEQYFQSGILVKSDRASMLNGLEVRAPFLDNELVDFVRRIPSRFKLRGSTTKHLLKEAVRGLLPDEVVARRKKGFGVPVGDWFHRKRLSLRPTPPCGLNASLVKNLYDRHLAGRSDERLFLFACAMLEHSSLNS